jgi:signal transduction histidine kinase
MSHELRTPLNAVIGFSEALKSGLLGPLAAPQVDAIGDVYESGKHLLSLINDILDLSKVEAGKMELELEPTDVQRLMQSTANVFREKASSAQVQLRLQMEAVGWAMVDQRKMRQIIYNLVSNAIKFTPAKGSVVLRMCLMAASQIPLDKVVGGELGAAASVPQFLTIRVSDTGIGINETDRSRLFQPFVQLDSGLARKYEGTGLGLALVKQMVDLHGGVVTLSSEPGQGSEFTVWLPHLEAGVPASGIAVSGRAG